MEKEEGLSEFVKFAYKCNKVKELDEAFDEYPVEEVFKIGKVDKNKIEEYKNSFYEINNKEN